MAGLSSFDHLCREEEAAAQKSAAKQESKRRKRTKDKAKTQQGKLAAAGERTQSSAGHGHAPPQPSQGPESLAEMSAAGPIPQQDSFVLDGQRQLASEPLPAGKSLQETLAGDAPQRPDPGGAQDLKPSSAEAISAEGLSASIESSSSGAPQQPSALAYLQYGSAAPGAGGLHAEGMADAVNARQSAHQAASGSAQAERLSAGPRVDGKQLLPAGHQGTVQQAVPGAEANLLGLHKAKKQRSKKGKQSAEAPDAVSPAACESNVFTHGPQLTDEGSFTEQVQHDASGSCATDAPGTGASLRSPSAEIGASGSGAPIRTPVISNPSFFAPEHVPEAGAVSITAASMASAAGGILESPHGWSPLPPAIPICVQAQILASVLAV